MAFRVSGQRHAAKTVLAEQAGFQDFAHVAVGASRIWIVASDEQNLLHANASQLTQYSFQMRL